MIHHKLRLDELDGLLVALYRTQRNIVFDYINKTSTKHGKLTDVIIDFKSDSSVFTNVDVEIQKAWVDLIQQYFPLAGIIGEEGDLKIECRYKTINIIFLIDPFDGTEQFRIGNFSNTGCIVGVIINGEFDCGIIGDGNGKYVILPHNKNHNYNIFIENQSEEFNNATMPFLKHKCLLVTDVYRYESYVVEDMATPKKHGGLFLGMHLFGGSIAASFIKLFTGVYGAIFLPPRPHGMNSWDWQTNYHLAKYLGYEIYEIRNPPFINWVNQSYEDTFVPFISPPTTEKTISVYPLIVFHRNRVDNIKSWFQWKKIESISTAQSLKRVSDNARKESIDELNKLKNKPPE